MNVSFNVYRRSGQHPRSGMSKQCAAAVLLVILYDTGQGLGFCEHRGQVYPDPLT